MDLITEGIELENKMDLITEDMKLAVKRGSYWLDENHPEWAQNIDLDNLNMGECSRCIIGQSVRDKSYIRVVGRAAELDDERTNTWAVNHGFEALDGSINRPDDESLDELVRLISSTYRGLEILWTEEVNKRLG